ncbi:MAG: hypothetical protein R3335_10480, partial [Anaerolineales bacterium]|nr:hypothetical protein [Anaerolineales bacterium]
TAAGGQRSPLVIVVSTLLIAGLFNPLRRRIQEVINRRFYRRHYDAEIILSDFLIELRDELDLDDVVKSLLGVVDDTLKPESVSLWLNTGPAPPRGKSFTPIDGR